MKQDIFFAQFSHLPFVTKEMLEQSANTFGIKPRTLDSFIYKGVKQGQLAALKRGIYVHKHFFDQHKKNTEYLFYITNILLQPSYISLESALQFYGLIPEAIHGTYSSVTLQLPRTIKNRQGIFSYRHIKKDLFSGFYYPKGTFAYAIAHPHKAIFDYLYFSTKGFTKGMHRDILEDLRIDIEDVTQEEKGKLQELLSYYSPISVRL